MTACQSLVEWSQRHGGPVDIVIRPWLALGPFFLAQPCSKSLHPVCRSCQCLFPFPFWSQFLHLQYGSLTANGFLWRTTMMTTCSGLPHMRETVASLLSLVAAAVVEPQFCLGFHTAYHHCCRHRTAAATPPTDFERPGRLRTLDLEVAKVQRLVAEPHSPVVAVR